MNYKDLILKEYPLWTLYLSEKQAYLGRAYAWLTRVGGMQRLSQISPEERTELLERVLPEYEAAIGQLFSPDHMNYSWLGNEFHVHGGHGHMHLVPRYASTREFLGTTFTDERWGKNYAPTPETAYPKELILKIRDALKKNLVA
ncbi:MAG: HIT family protein [Minisyncoccia bacterium]